MTQWIVSQCGYNDKPSALDTTSSPTTVYERRNFKEIIVPAVEEGEEDTTMWEYEERTYTKEEYDMITSTRDTIVPAISFKHDNDIIDEYTVNLIEEGLL